MTIDAQHMKLTAHPDVVDLADERRARELQRAGRPEQ
jgi:hypothetical protein